MKKTFALLIISGITLFSNNQAIADNHQHDHNKMTKTDSTVNELNIVNENINGKNRYSPSVLIAKKGQKLRLKVFNATEVPHGFSIDEFKLQETLNPKDNVIEFTPDQAGLFKIYCQYHPAHLSGQILVIE